MQFSNIPVKTYNWKNNAFDKFLYKAKCAGMMCVFLASKLYIKFRLYKLIIDQKLISSFYINGKGR